MSSDKECPAPFPTDLFCRAAVYPHFIRSEQFDPEMLMRFSPLGDFAQALSLAGWDKCCSEVAVHDFGEQVAVQKNKRDAKRAGFDDETQLPDKDKAHYLGYGEILARDLNNLDLQNSYHLLIHEVSEGDDRHFQLELHLHPEVSNKPKSDRALKRDVRFARSYISDRIQRIVPQKREKCCARTLSLQEEFINGWKPAPDSGTGV